MRLHFNGSQHFQQRAISAIADVFTGQKRYDFNPVFELTQAVHTVANHLDLTDEELLANVRTVQERNGITPDSQLCHITQEIRGAKGSQQSQFVNLSVEMETGTGKTYVYIRTALELYQQYGLRKFIIVVPSVAIREGVFKTLNITRNHFREMYSGVPYNYAVYDSKSISRVRNFATSDAVEFLIMTIDSFNKDDNVIRQATDRLQGDTPLFMIQSVRPILILDEPQNMESDSRVHSLSTLHPLFALRYSATHRNVYNLVYRLTPFEAYRLGLVKSIEVDAVTKEKDHNDVFVRVEQVRSNSQRVQAQISVHRRNADGEIVEKRYLFSPGESLQTKAQRPEYATYVIDEINIVEQYVRFTNGILLPVGRALGADRAELFKQQIRRTIETHMRKQEKLAQIGIKVLSLFFVDRVENFAGDSSQKSAAAHDGLYPGIIRELFDEAFNEIKDKYDYFRFHHPENVRRAYFAQRRVRGEVELMNTNGQSQPDAEAYDLIMRNKERLLSFEEPVCFIFSHSALREGWDNPNVCQICTLNQTESEVKKRQEVGRGMRLVVDQTGRRREEPALNVLTIVANESYEKFVELLQHEMIEAFGKEGAPPKPRDASKKKDKGEHNVDMSSLPADFVELWDRIKHRTRYRVSVQTERLIDDVVRDLNDLRIVPPRIVSQVASISVDARRDELDYETQRKLVLKTPLRHPGVPNLLEIIEDLMGHIQPPIRLTRRTLAQMVSRVANLQAAFDNPQEFARQAVGVIRARLVRQLVDGIQYEKDGTWYEMSQWETPADQPLTESSLVVNVRKSISQWIQVDSNPEVAFARALVRMADVRFFVKLPKWFKVTTPIGTYTPDWAIVMDSDDDGSFPLYLVRETKDTNVEDKRRAVENQRVHCGKRHFEALGVDFKVVTDASDLP